MKTRKGWLMKRGKTYHAAWKIGGKLFTKSTHKTDKREATTELARIMEPYLLEDEARTLEHVKARLEGTHAELAKIEAERNPPLRLALAWGAYQNAPGRPDSGERTLSDYGGYWRAFLAWMKEAHPEAAALRDVTPATAEEYAAHLIRERGFSANSYNKHRNFLELLFRVLSKPARLEVNPWTEIGRKRIVSNSRRELTIDELRRVCESAQGEMRTLFALGVYTGLRLGDAATLRWGEVDLTRGAITRIPNKTARRNQKPVIVPLHPTLAGMLSDIPEAARGEYVLPETAAAYGVDDSALARRIQTHFHANGITTQRPGTGRRIEAGPQGGRRIIPTGKRAVVEVGFHSMRHSFVSLCRASNAPLSVVESIVGHASPAMTRHYTHTGEAAAMAAVATLPDVMSNGKTPAALPAHDPVAEIRERVRAIAEGLTAATWEAARADLLALAD